MFDGVEPQVELVEHGVASPQRQLKGKEHSVSFVSGTPSMTDSLIAQNKKSWSRDPMIARHLCAGGDGGIGSRGGGSFRPRWGNGLVGGVVVKVWTDAEMNATGFQAPIYP